MYINYNISGDDAYMIVAIRRCSPNKNENVGLEKIVRRTVVSAKYGDKDYKEQLKFLEASVSGFPGYWRMYRSVNMRDLEKGRKMLQIKLIERGEGFEHKIDSEWKSLLMKAENKAERKFLVDIDTDNLMVRHDVIKMLRENSIDILEENQTPNGYHIITNPFNPQLLDEDRFKDVELKKDELFFLYDFGDAPN
jgi:hypothetical protein